MLWRRATQCSWVCEGGANESRRNLGLERGSGDISALGPRVIVIGEVAEGKGVVLRFERVGVTLLGWCGSAAESRGGPQETEQRHIELCSEVQVR